MKFLCIELAVLIQSHHSYSFMKECLSNVVNCYGASFSSCIWEVPVDTMDLSEDFVLNISFNVFNELLIIAYCYSFGKVISPLNFLLYVLDNSR